MLQFVIEKFYYLFLFKAEQNNKLLIEIIDLQIESTENGLCPDSLEIRYFALGQLGIRYI